MQNVQISWERNFTNFDNAKLIKKNQKRSQKHSGNLKIRIKAVVAPNIYLLKNNKRNTRKRCICSNLVASIQVLLLLLLTIGKYLFAGIYC